MKPPPRPSRRLHVGCRDGKKKYYSLIRIHSPYAALVAFDPLGPVDVEATRTDPLALLRRRNPGRRQTSAAIVIASTNSYVDRRVANASVRPSIPFLAGRRAPHLLPAPPRSHKYNETSSHSLRRAKFTLGQFVHCQSPGRRLPRPRDENDSPLPPPRPLDDATPTSSSATTRNEFGFPCSTLTDIYRIRAQVGRLPRARYPI